MECDILGAVALYAARIISHTSSWWAAGNDLMIGEDVERKLCNRNKLIEGGINMVNDSMKKELVAHKVYSAWQFITYTEKNIDTVQYCADTINNIIGKMTMKTVRWQQDISTDFVDDVTKDGKKVKRLSVTTENSPVYEVRVAGEKIDPWFLFEKLLRDFFQYTMNAFDSMSQIINAGLLANKRNCIFCW